MNVALWIITVVLAVLTFIPGIVKITQPRDALTEKMTWANDFTERQIKAIGVLEVLAAIGLIAPAIVGFALFLVPAAAVGIILIQLGAIWTHVKRGEAGFIAINIILILLSAFVAWGRFGMYPLQ